MGEGESDGDGVADISEKVTATLPRCTDGPPWPSRERRRQGSQYHYKSDQLASNGMAFMGYSALGAYRSFATAPSLPQLEAAAVAAVAKTSKTRIPHIGREAAGHLAPHPAPRVDGSGSGFEQAVAHESAEVAVVTPEEFMAKHSIRVVGDQMEGYQPCLVSTVTYMTASSSWKTAWGSQAQLMVQGSACDLM